MKSVIIIISVFLMGVFTSFTYASGVNQEITTRTVHNKNQFENQDFNLKFIRVVLKVHDGTGVRVNKVNNKLSINKLLQNANTLENRGLRNRQIRHDILAINQFLADNDIKVHQLIQANESVMNKRKMKAEQYWGHEVAELQTYFQIVLDGSIESGSFRSLINTLNEYQTVEIAYLEPLAFPPSGGQSSIQANDSNPTCEGMYCETMCDSVPLDPLVEDFSPLQGYLDQPPIGINANEIHHLASGKGDGVRLIDIEGGYYDHSDHKELFYHTGHGSRYYYRHGNAVLGIVGALDNNVGIKGVAPDAALGFRGIYNENLFDNWDEARESSSNVVSNIFWASNHSLEGVVLLELQRPGVSQDPDCPCGICSATPIEFWPAEFDAIQMAVGNGTVVVEAAANGARNLDNPVFDVCSGVAGVDLPCFDRTVRDSGAIMVTGSRSDGVTPICAQGQPNYGSRVDVHSWGEHIPNTSDKILVNHDGVCNDYDDDFGATSGASAIIAGAVAVFQSRYKHLSGNRLDPLSLRSAFVNTGTPQAPMNVGGHDILIGVHPDLVAAIEYALENF